MASVDFIECGILISEVYYFIAFCVYFCSCLPQSQLGLGQNINSNEYIHNIYYLYKQYICMIFTFMSQDKKKFWLFLGSDLISHEAEFVRS